MHKPTLFLFLCASLGLALGLIAQDPSPVSAHPVGSAAAYSMTAEDEWGNTLRTYHHGAQTFVLGTHGQRYNLRLRNQTSRRVEAVVSVDGRDVVSGRVGDFARERGYVIGPYDSLLIEGFRTSMSDVASFRFTSPEDSYSSRMGTPENVGVIGAAFFPERPRPAPRPQPVAPRDYGYDRHEGRGAPRKESKSGLGSAASAPSPSAPSARADASGRASAESARSRGAMSDDAYAGERENNLGTQYGEARESRVEEVAFRRADASHPAQVIALRYDDESGLRARGIELYQAPVVRYEEPSPFPRNRFAPPPP
jgi:hypothetical protein